MDSGLKLCVAIFECILSLFSFLLTAISPVLFLMVWVTLMLMSKWLVSKEARSASQFLKFIFIGLPLGVLFGAAVHENGYGEMTSAMAGCAMALVADQVLDGTLPRRFIDALIEKINR